MAYRIISIVLFILLAGFSGFTFFEIQNTKSSLENIESLVEKNGQSITSNKEQTDKKIEEINTDIDYIGKRKSAEELQNLGSTMNSSQDILSDTPTTDNNLVLGEPADSSIFNKFIIDENNIQKWVFYKSNADKGIISYNIITEGGGETASSVNIGEWKELYNPEVEDLDAFEESFKNCTPGASITARLELSEGFSVEVKNEIQGKNFGKCTIKSTNIEHVHPELKGKSMTCDYNNSVSFELAGVELSGQKTKDSNSGTNLSGCKGEAWDIMSTL